ncbi:MAG: response regulator [Marinilabiliaceae bacterium]|nr:response regulator [Marinilabiliaceae bacterium]
MFKILIVEDDRFISTILSFFIKSLGHQSVERCRTGAEALEACQKIKPDVVLMDIHLDGDMDGISTAEKIQREHEVPVIYISGDTSTEIVERAIVTNSYGYLVKPIQKRELGITIDLAYYKHKVDMEQKKREQVFRQFISAAAIPIVIVSDGRIKYLNMNALKLLHSHYIEDMMGLPFLDFITDKHKDEMKKLLEQTPNPSTEINTFKSSIKAFHGKEIDVAVSSSWIKFNEADALQLILFDIADEIKALYELNRYKQIFKDGFKPYVEINPNFEIIDYNEPFKKLLSYPTEIMGKHLRVLTPSLNIDTQLIAERVKNIETTEYETHFNTAAQMLKCKIYVFRNKELEIDKIIISVLETIHYFM